jgi:hypothetical protein
MTPNKAGGLKPSPSLAPHVCVAVLAIGIALSVLPLRTL